MLTTPAAAAQDSLARMEADGEQKRQNSAAEKVKVLFASAASDKVLPEGGALTMKGSAARIGWTHVFADMTSRWDTMMVIQDSEEMLDDGKNIMATCGVLAALILSFTFEAEPPTADRYSIWVFFGDYDNFVAEIYNFIAFVLKLACTIEVRRRRSIERCSAFLLSGWCWRWRRC